MIAFFCVRIVHLQTLYTLSSCGRHLPFYCISLFDGDSTDVHRIKISSYRLCIAFSPGILRLYFRKRLEELSSMITGECENGYEVPVDSGVCFTHRSDMASRAGAMEVEKVCDQSVTLKNNELIKNIGKLVRDLRSLGFTSVTEDAYASAIFSLLKVCTLLPFRVHIVFIVWLMHFRSLHCCSCFDCRLKFNIWLEMTTEVLFWTPLKNGFRFVSLCIHIKLDVPLLFPT